MDQDRILYRGEAFTLTGNSLRQDAAHWAEVQPDGSFAFKIEQGGLIRNYVGKVEKDGNVEGKMTFTGGMEGVVVEFSTESRPVEAPPMPAGGPPPGGPGMPPPGK